METRKKNKKKNRINKILTVILLVVVLVFFSLIFYINILPIFYLILLIILFIFFIGLTILLNNKKKKIFRLIGRTLSIIIITIVTFITIYLFNTLGFLFNMTNGNYTIYNYNVIVLNTSNDKKLKDLKNKDMGISKTTEREELTKAKNIINEKIKINYYDFEDINELSKSLINKEVDCILLEDSELSLIEEENKEQYELFNIIYEIEIKNDIEDLRDSININKEPFNIFISGIDTFGDIKKTSRSDVNMILTVNPKSEKILITWIPRDYYVNINDSGYKDKLTHAGLYGISNSIYAMEKLFETDINYYVKVNFTSLIEVVDLLGGITIYNDETFRSKDGYLFKKGNVTLNGEKALSFVRERKNVTGGDLGRGKNQIKVLEALLKKAMSPNIITKYNSLLKSLDGAFVTNLSQSTMTSFVKYELSKGRKWKIDSNTLKGIDSLEYTYSYKNQKLYVMKPTKESVDDAINKIKEIIS